MNQKTLRQIPSVEKVLQALGDTGLPRALVVTAVRMHVAELRRSKRIPEFEEVVAGVCTSIEGLQLSRIQPVINGTGILIHTNLGRAPLGPAVVETLEAIGANYNNLEFDLATGERGGRASYLEQCLATLCNAEAAMVANNCAAALILILRYFVGGTDQRLLRSAATKNEVIISRGELVQIGGGFRIPEILETSGARLREVGTTNKTSINDYARAINKQTALILRVHRSNFFMGGFVESPPTEELAALAKKKRIPFVEDLGSGAMVSTERFGGVEHEPTPAEVLARGVDLVCFSGDKLLGGPQAGVIAGKARLVSALKKDAFFRALRCDKLILGALQTTAELYLSGGSGVPVIEMLQSKTEELVSRAEAIVKRLSGLPVKAGIGKGRAQMGGGTLPGAVVPSVTVDLEPQNLNLAQLGERLRKGKPPVVGYAAAQRFKIDLRTVFPRQDLELAEAIRKAFSVGEKVG
jgi:L-seryl-tRNA(Ser) seleniumtransferase